MKDKQIRKAVKKHYAKIAEESRSCCSSVNLCCAGTDLTQDIGRKIGYTEAELARVPDGANLGLGCGNPVALASLKEGETVLDLGSGAGFDCFLAADKVGSKGRVIGVDMTPEMIRKAKENAEKGKYKNVEFRLGEIGNLPLAENSVDVVISNCVINLSTDKRKVFLEVFRVLNPGGRLMISDMVLLKELPEFIKNSIEAYVGCLSGAIKKDEYIRVIKEVGFQEVRIINEKYLPVDCMTDDATVKAIIKNLNISLEKAKEIARSVISIIVYAVKPKEAL